jgi:hypothetical protein
LLPNWYSLLTYAGRRNTAQALYEQYGNPLEQEHTGEYVAISTSGKTIVGKSFRQAMTHALEKLGKGNFDYKIGSQAVGSFR